MDVLTALGGFNKTTQQQATDSLLLSSNYEEEEIELLGSGYIQQESDIFSLNLSPPHSNASSFGSESGITSPGNLFDDDFLDGLLSEEFSPSLPDPTTSARTSTTHPISTSSYKPISPPAPVGSKNISGPPVMTHDPKVKIYQDGLKLSEGQIERNRKNAIAAKINRQKKKEHVNNLEKHVRTLSTENSSLKEKCGHMEVTINELQHEVLYLKSVLANESTLSSVLAGLVNIKGVQLSVDPSLIDVPSRRPPVKRGREEDDVSGNKKVKSDGTSISDGGICLHIAGQVASLELCSHCSLKAKRSGTLQ